VKPAFWTLLVLGALAYYAFLPVNQMIMRASIVAQAQARGQDAAQLEATAGGMVRFMSYGGGLMVAISYAVAIAVAALLLQVIGRTIEAGGRTAGALIATYAAFICCSHRSRPATG
jgi:hypothetical protein